jgi:EpsD family peptidyl-prolyl cis-trans isomerase
VLTDRGTADTTKSLDHMSTLGAFEMVTSFVRLCRVTAIVGSCAMMLAACGKKDQVASGQVVAHVGDQVVTTQELENEFRWANVPADKQKDPEVIKRVLGELVARKYLLQQALAAKLDREPGVLLDVLRSREQVLENAYLMRTVAAKSPGKADVDRFIANNPSKFAYRKIFNVEQIGFALGPNSQTIVDANKDAKSLDEIDQQLTSAGIPHSRQIGVLSSGDIPPDFYNSIEAKKADDVFFVRSGPNGVFFKVKSEEVRPLEGEAAANLARQLMRADALKGEAAIATYSANLEAKYEGDYAKIMQQGGDKKN